ncbi:MAG: DNA polymerase III subunit beta [Cyclobacteriaceae bacterium]
MKFTCDKEAILKEISIAQEIIYSRNALSILSNVLLEAVDNVLTIKATDLKVAFHTRIPVEVSTPGSTTVFCDKFLNIIRSLPAGEIEFEEIDNIIHIKPVFKKINFKLKSIASDKFPEVQITSSESYFEIPQTDFIEMITQTIFSVSDDETRYFLNGTYFEKDGDNIIMVATDGKRLSYIEKSSGSDMPEFNGIIIPPKVLNMIKKLASGEGSFKLAITDKNIFINFDDQKISSALIDGQFPNYKKVIPREQLYNVSLNRIELLESIRRISILVEQKSRRMYLKFNEGSLTIQSEESEIGDAAEELSCDYNGEPISLALNYQFIIDPLKAITEETVTLNFTDPNKAVSIFSPSEKHFFHIIMPMHVD